MLHLVYLRHELDMVLCLHDELALLAKLLVVWFIVSFGAGIIFVDILNEIQFFGFKLGFWFAQQGAIYVFVALIFVYMAKMNAMDKRYGVDEE